MTVAGRTPLESDHPLTDPPFIRGDYAAAGFTPEVVTGFDAVVFFTGHDVRHVAPEDADEQFWARYECCQCPGGCRGGTGRGSARLRPGGQLLSRRPAAAGRHQPVRAGSSRRRHGRSRAGRARLRGDDGQPAAGTRVLPGAAARRFARIVSSARGERDDRMPPLVARPGGTNDISVRSLARALVGPLERGTTGATSPPCWPRWSNAADGPRVGGLAVLTAVVVGNPRAASRTLAAALDAARALTGEEPRADQTVSGSVDRVGAADLVVASPTRKGAHTGLLKLFLDCFAAGTCMPGVAVPLMRGGSPAHSLAPELTLWPMLTELGATGPGRALHVVDRKHDESEAYAAWPAATRSLVPTILSTDGTGR